MTSEIRANTLKNRVGLGTVSFTNTGPVVSGIVTASSGIDIPAMQKISFGDPTGAHKLEIYHNTVGSSYHYIRSTSSSNHLILEAPSVGPWTDAFIVRNKSNTQNKFRIHSDGQTFLYYNNQEKIKTTSTGATVTGTLVATTFDGNLTGNVTGNISGGTVAGSTGTFSGDVSITDKIIHTDDTNTAIRFPADDQVSIETAGSQRFRIDSSGNVGIDETGTILGKLHVVGGRASGTAYNAAVFAGGQNSTSGSGVKLYLSGCENDPISRGVILESIMTDNANAHRFSILVGGASAAPTERFRITPSGVHFYGNQTNLPNGIFGFRYDKTNDTDLSIENLNNSSVNNNAGIRLASNHGNIKLRYFNNGGFYIQNSSASGYLHYFTNNVSRLYIDSSGNVNINNQGTIASSNGALGRRLGVKSTANNVIIGETTQSGNGYGLHLESRQTGRSGNARIAQIGMKNDASGNGQISLFTAASGADVSERMTITSGGNVGINHSSPNTQLIVRAPGGSGHASAQVHSGDSSTIMNMQTVQGSEGRFGMNTNHNLAIYTNGLEKLHLSKTGSLFLKCLDTVPVNQAESGHYNSTGYNAGHVLGLMVKRSICVSDADTKGVGGIFLSHTRNVVCNGTTYNMMTLHNREGTFVGDVYVGFSAGGAGVVRHYKFTCLYSASTITSIDNASRGGKSESISVNITSSNDAHFFQVIPNMSTNETCRVSMTIVGAACGRNDGAGGDYYTVNYN